MLHHYLRRSLKKNFSNTLINGFRATGLYPWNVDAIDFSKCLGNKNEKNDETQKLAEDNTRREIKNLLFRKFFKIIGDERIKLFQAMEAQGEARTENNFLYHIWKEFHISSESSQVHPKFCDVNATITHSS